MSRIDLQGFASHEADGSRTRNHRIDSPPATSADTGLALDGAQEGASAAGALPADPELAQVTAAWDALPTHIRAAILTLVNSATEAKP